MSSKHILGVLCLSASVFACGSENRAIDRVLLVTIDTLRSDHVGFAGYDVATPNLDRLARSGVTFTQAVSVAPITLPAHSSIMTGLYPPAHGVRHNGIFRLPDAVETLAEVLSRDGWATGAFVGAFVLDRRFGLDQGFDHYDDELPEENPAGKIYYAERRAEEVVSRALVWIETQGDRRFFLWVHLFDPHAPHNPPPPYEARYPGRPYDAEIAYTDGALGPLFEAVDAIDGGERTAIVVTADHGEGLGEHGESTHTLFVYDATMRVPLIIRSPGLPSEMRVERQVRSVDIAPTILELAGLEFTAPTDGIGLVEALRAGNVPELAAYGETFGTRVQFNWSELRFLRKGGYKLIDAPRPELYYLRADPKETRNLWDGGRADVGRRLFRELTALKDAFGPDVLTPTVPLDEKTRRRLESLGYVASRASREPLRRPDPKDRVGVFERLQELLSPELTDAEKTEGYREILAAEPANTLARSRLANHLAAEGRLAEAVEQYRELLRLSEVDANGWENLASALLLLGRVDEALLITERAVAEAPWYLELQVLRGEALEKAGRLGEARDAYARAVALRPEVPDNHWRHGTLARALGDAQTAERDFREALRRDTSFVPARLALARLLSARGRGTEAIELLSSADPQDAEIEAGLGEAHIALGRYDEARALLESAHRKAPGDPRVLALLGPLYGRSGDLEKATEVLEKSIALGGTSPEIRRNLALVYLRRGWQEKAIAQLRMASRDAPGDAAVWFALGNARARAGQARAALEALERAVALRPEWPEAAFNLALAYQRADSDEKALEMFRRFLSLSAAPSAGKRAEALKRIEMLDRRLGGR